MFKRLLEIPRVQTLIAYVQKYERYAGIAALFGGFIFDTFTLGAPGELFGTFVLGGYILVSAGCIVALSFYTRTQKISPIFLLLFLQFCFGNISGGLLVLYGQSGTFEGSFLFFAVFGVFVVANEFLRQRYALLNFHIGAWFFLALAYSALVMPVFLKQMGDNVFIGSVFFAAAAVGFLISLIYFVSPTGFINVKKRVGATLSGIGVLFIGLYFFNIIPPVPLSLHQIGIFHSVTRTEGIYEATLEKPEWYEFFRMTNKIFTAEEGEKAYCFVSVRAPVSLKAALVHRWESYDEDLRKWQTAQVLSFPITGGRAEGFRGYSEKEVVAGRWRCSVETTRGALVGRTTFEVKEGLRQPLSITVL
ncbi:MAG: DUF2914 domain-containing protein [bacterium]|nr:DUF2914 domain-containing protein [bacterium]